MEISIAPRYNYKQNMFLIEEYFIQDPYDNTEIKICIIDDNRVHIVGILHYSPIDIIEQMDRNKLLDEIHAFSQTSRIILRINRDTFLYARGLSFKAREIHHLFKIQFPLLNDEQYTCGLRICEYNKYKRTKYWSHYVFCYKYT